MPTIDADDIAEVMSSNEEFNDIALINNTGIGGKFFNTYIESLDVIGTTPMFSCSTLVLYAITPVIDRGTEITINSIIYTIENIKNNDNGLTTLILSTP